jgi:hypothetical protein
LAKKVRVCPQIDRSISRTCRNTQDLDEVKNLCYDFDNMLFREDGEHNNNT